MLDVTKPCTTPHRHDYGRLVPNNSGPVFIWQKWPYFRLALTSFPKTGTSPASCYGQHRRNFSLRVSRERAIFFFA